VVTANKTLIAYRGRDLSEAAAPSGARLACEASVCGAIPVLATLRHLAGDRILSIRGIVNGSCNFILSRLAEGRDLRDSVGLARAKGLVEPDPSADLSGRDSAEKLCVLAGACGAALAPDRVACEGIDRLTPEDVAAARRSGRVIKLLAELDLSGQEPRARVGPTLLPRAHALAGVEEEENAVTIQSTLAGELFLRGRGAGPAPTASAVLGDVVGVLGLAPARAPALRPRLLHAAVADPGAAWPARRHEIRVHGEALGPEQVLTAARDHGIEPDEVQLTRGAARVLTHPISSVQATACGLALAERRAERALVMPVL
jgi:homoserine dehydrogenase